MRDSLLHRGPDGTGLVNIGQATFTHTRLSIIDLSERGSQPMMTPDGRYCLTFNGEIYNFKELRVELLRTGVCFQSESDTEVLLHAFATWGPACLQKLNGMFAFAIWDNQTKQLFLARDRFGKKPLYYRTDGDRTIHFASETRALLAPMKVKPKLSAAGLNCFLALGYVLAPNTAFRDIFKVRPAHWMVFRNAATKPLEERYWDYADAFHSKSKASEQDASRELLDVFQRAVAKRLISDVPLGAFLSGGVDSSSIVAMMKKVSAVNPATFTMGFSDDSYSEIKDARRLSQHIGTSHKEFICSSDEESLQDDILVFDEPFADNSLVPTLMVSRFAAQEVKVVLTGDGADELFAGYPTYRADKLHRVASILPSIVNKRLGYFFKQRAVNDQTKLGLRFRLGQFLNGCAYSPEEAHFRWRLIFDEQERVKILGVQYRECVLDTDPVHQFLAYYEQVKGLHWLDQHLYVDCMTWLPDDILVKVDRATMRFGLEARCPYLDHELAEFAASLPVDMKLAGFQGKYLLKESFKGLLPEFVLTKKKSGFNAPIGKWLNPQGANEFQTFVRFVASCWMRDYELE